MTAALRAEFLKLRTTRLVAGMTGLAVALTALIGVLEAVTAASSGSRQPPTPPATSPAAAGCWRRRP